MSDLPKTTQLVGGGRVRIGTHGCLAQTPLLHHAAAVLAASSHCCFSPGLGGRALSPLEVPASKLPALGLLGLCRQDVCPRVAMLSGAKDWAALPPDRVPFPGS